MCKIAATWNSLSKESLLAKGDMKRNKRTKQEHSGNTERKIFKLYPQFAFLWVHL